MGMSGDGAGYAHLDAGQPIGLGRIEPRFERPIRELRVSSPGSIKVNRL